MKEESDMVPRGNAATPQLAALAGRVRDIARRAASQSWEGWSEEDTAVLEAAAREIEVIEESLKAGMEDAFQLGRKYGKNENVLSRLDLQIARVRDRVASAAWRGSSPATARSNGKLDPP
jgi:flagellar biosynthesis/type III secretory pathway protein FliH